MFKADNQTTDALSGAASSVAKSSGNSLGVHAMPKTSEKSLKIWFILGGAMLLIIIILFLLII